MESITIPVPPFIAQAFAKADASVKRRAEIYINAWLTDLLSEQSANKRLFTLMKKGTDEAKANGFIPENMDELLKDEN
jgi:hypothetical protein